MVFFRSITLFSMLLLVNNSGSLSGQQTDTAPAQKPVGVKSMSLPGLDNVFQVDEAVYSGSGPAEQRSFDALQKLGVKTIISVDGTEPHLEMARPMGGWSEFGSALGGRVLQFQKAPHSCNHRYKLEERRLNRTPRGLYPV